jgi:ubiquinone/menaquinone biosynthesis C-methylase UbiE
MPIKYRSRTVKKETLHTVSLVAPHVTPGASVLDVGCGEGYVLEELAARGAGELFGVDVVDIRQEKTRPFRLFDGVTLPFIDRRFDVVVLSFVLHHVPDDRKCALLREAMRVCRGTVVIVEDTPVTLFDRLMNRRHGETYRRKIHSTAAYGFLTEQEWRWLFRGMGLEPQARPLSRFCRSILQPFARTAFLLRAPASVSAAV